MSYVGIDISKGWFDAYWLKTGHVRRFCNNGPGWRQLAEWVGADAHVVMEATGPYYLRGASWLAEGGFTLSVLNPLIIRRYSQMRLSRAKTDAKDARLIAEYARDHRPPAWIPASAGIQAMRQLMSVRDGLLRQCTMLRGQQEAFAHAAVHEELVHQVLEAHMKALSQAVHQLDKRLEALARQHFEGKYQALQTIPGIGPKTALLLLCLTDGFTRFDQARKLASYVGLCPRVYRSGSSISGHGAICKLGCSQMRKLLYMCSWTAKRCNPGCVDLYQRMKEKGKPERVIKIAIAHKLLRQAFAVGKSGLPFDKERAMAA